LVFLSGINGESVEVVLPVWRLYLGVACRRLIGPDGR
jgi:hypothetical protein